jgi:hypothetical protein
MDMSSPRASKRRSLVAEPATLARPKKRPFSSQARQNTLEYIERFSARSESSGSNARGGGYQTQTDGMIMAKLRQAVIDSSMHRAEACSALRSFIIAYGVSRTFAGLREDNAAVKLAPLLSHLRKRWPILQQLEHPDDIVREVDDLTQVCFDAGFNRNISFATKALCMLSLPVPIYSSEGKAYLRLSASAPFKEYQAAWMAKYFEERAEYEAAAAECMPQIAQATPSGMPVPSAEWFGMRGLDIHMLAVGGPMR